MASIWNMRFRRFKLLMWKNYRWRRYFWIWTLIEVLVPILIAIYVPYMVLIRSSSWGKSSLTKYSASYQPVNNKTFILQKSLIFDIIAYAPWNKDNQLAVEKVINKLSQIPIEDDNSTKYKTFRNITFISEEDLESFMFNRSLCSSCIGIIFEENSKDIFKYKLRLNDFSRTLEPFARDRPTPSQHDVYLERGFAGIQLLLNEYYLREQLDELEDDWYQSELSEFQGFPQPEYETSTIPRSKFITVASFSIIVTSVALSIPFINAVVQEKGNGVKELMKLHGVEDWIIWLSWAIHAFIVPAISLTVMTIIFKAPILTGGVELVRYVTFPVLWILLMLYCLANISFVCLFCAMFHKGIVASFAFIIVMIVNFLWITSYNELNLQHTVLFTALIPASSFAIAIETVQKYEKLGAPLSLKCYFCLFYPVCALIFDTILYSILTLSISSIYPGKYGVSKSPFLFIKNYWKKLNEKSESLKEATELNNTTVKYVEQLPSHRKPFILVKNLTKQSESTYAIGEVDLAIYENEILVILGHRGAGKTTFLSILAGLSPYDEGILHYKEKDLKENLDKFRTDLGICFQENRLFEFISVEDHLVFFAMLKGLSKTDASREAIYSMNVLEMRENEKTKISAASLNTKRKLNLAISLLKRPKILILDEPTFGMDFLSKRRVWSIIKNLRQNRTIILSTGYAKEADILADRIAIMQNGSLLAHGTHEYLEKTFGKGYELMITSEKNTNHAPIMELVEQFVPNALVTQDKQDEIVFKIQPEEIQKFAKLIKHLEENKNSLGILNIEVAYATLEQILSKIQNNPFDPSERLSAISDKIYTGSFSNLQGAVYLTNLSSPNPNEFSSHSNFKLKKNFLLRIQQIKVLFAIKILYTKRTFLNAFAKLGLPSLIFAAVLLTVTRIEPKTEIDLSLRAYAKPCILIKVNAAKDSDFLSAFSTYVQAEGGSVGTCNENIVEKLIQIGKGDKIEYGTSLLAAFEYEENKLKILYNHWELYGLPIAINLYTNIFLTNKNTPRQVININKPMPYIGQGQCGNNSEKSYRLAMLTLISVFFAFYTVDSILYFFEFTNKDMAKKRMHLEMISNVPSWIYWLSTFVFDFLIFISVFLIRMLILVHLNDMGLYFNPFSDFHRAFLLMIILFGISGLLCVYSMSFLFKPTKSMYATFLVLNALCSISMHVFNQIESTVLNDNGHIGLYIFYYPLKYVILFIPFLNFTLLFNKFLEIWKHNSACDKCEFFMKSACEETLTKLSIWSFPSKENPHGLSLGLLFLLVDIILFAILLSLINMGYIEHWYNLFSTLLLKKEDDNTYSDEDNDLNQEIIRIQNIKKDKSEYDKVPLIADKLSKNQFKLFKFVPAVENISFLAERGTCFGILGINGSGKTTVIKMLAAEIIPVKGTVSVDGVELNTNKKEFISMIGYCPQTNPLFNEFTGKEILKFFGLLNGIKREDIETMVNEWISAFGLEKMQDKNCKTYNHSSKRKLSAAISFIGDPKVIILDEPTNGVDADTKIKFQENLTKSKESGKTVIMSSVSVDECLQLCDRISILMNGEIRCIGTATHLKKRYAVGYSVTITIRRDISTSKSRLVLEQNILSVFDHQYCHLKEEHRDSLYYHIKDPFLTWSDAFEKMETIKENHDIVQNYILKNINLKEVFTAFIQPEYTSSKTTLYET